MSPRPWFLACCLASFAASRYRISLTVRSELEGQEFIPVGAKPFKRVAEGQLSWPATRRFFSVNAASNAGIEKTLDEFSTRERPIPPQRGEGDQSRQR